MTIPRQWKMEHIWEYGSLRFYIVTMPLQGGYADSICNNIIFSIFNGLILFICNNIIFSIFNGLILFIFYLGNLHRGGDHSHNGSH